MSLKEELAKLEKEEAVEEQDEIELIREQEARDEVTGLYCRIAVIVEYIDNHITKEKTSSEYVKGYKDGVKAILEKRGDDTDKFPNREVIEAMQKALGITLPLPDLAGNLADILSQIQMLEIVKKK